MGSFLSELGRRLAERWLTLLVLPGLLYVGTAAGGAVLGQRHWADAASLRARFDAAAQGPGTHSPGATLLAAGAVLGASAAAGLAAQASARLLTRVWLGDWPSPFGPAARRLTARRRRRWNRARQRYEAALLEAARPPRPAPAAPRPGLVRLNAARNRISLAEPQRPTWTGDRIMAVDQRVYSAYDLDLESAWPRLWLVVPDSVRAELRTARAAFDSAAAVSGWGLLYGLAGVRWWPAAVVGAGLLAAGLLRGRSAMDVLADLVESTVDVHGADLARALGIDCPGPLTRGTGLAVTRLLRKDT